MPLRVPPFWWHIQPWQHTPSSPENICRKFTICMARSRVSGPIWLDLSKPCARLFSRRATWRAQRRTSRHEALHEVSADMSEIAGHKWSRAMRAVTSDTRQRNPAENFLRVLDQFACAAQLFERRAGRRRLSRAVVAARAAPNRHRTSPPAPSPRAPRARMRWTGFLSVLFVGGLGLAVLAGPANCPCSSAFAVAEQSSLARLGYVQNADMMTQRETAARRRRAADADHRRAHRAARERERRIADHHVGARAVARRADREERRPSRHQPPAACR